MNTNVLFITGAGSGIGQLTARRALDAGWAVAALDVNTAGLEALGDRPTLLKLAVDVTRFQEVEAAVARAESTLGPVTRVVNAAAIMPLGLLAEQSPELMHKVMDINYGGLVNVTRAVLPRLLQRGRGQFVSYASLAGHMPILYMGAYDASKFAVTAFTEVLHHENRGSGVQFACVCPPPVATPLLKQAKDTTWPKTFDISPPITAEQVVDAVERGLARGSFWIYPGPLTRLFIVLRRLIPGLLWRAVHWQERR